MDDKANNQEIYDCSESQKLSSQEIEQMKKSQDVSGRVYWFSKFSHRDRKLSNPIDVALDKKLILVKPSTSRKKASKYVVHHSY